MHRTPVGEPDDLISRHPRGWPGIRADLIGRLRPRAWIAGFRERFRLRRRRRLLFLDDDPCRAELFLREHPQAAWVTTVADCLARLAETWDEIHLDHDLGGKTFVDSSEADCGMEVIRWLRKEPHPHLKRTAFFVHTHNAAAGLLMVLLMREGGYKAEFRPFGHDLRKLLAHNEARSGAGPEAEVSRSRAMGLLGSVLPLGSMALARLVGFASSKFRRVTSRAPGACSSTRSGVAESGTGPAVPSPDDPSASCQAPGEAKPGEAVTGPQDNLPGSSPVIQPPPRTRSS